MKNARPLDHCTKAVMRTTRIMLVTIPIIGMILYCAFLRTHFAAKMLPWYWQALLFAALYIADIYIHELIHGLFYKIFNPKEKLHFRFGVLGSSCGMDHCSFKRWQFILTVITPAISLFFMNIIPAFLIPQFFPAFYFIAVIGLASGSNDFLLAGMAIKQARTGEWIIAAGKSFEVISAEELVEYQGG